LSSSQQQRRRRRRVRRRALAAAVSVPVPVCVLLLPISHALLLAVARARVAGFEGVRSAVSIGVMALSVWVAAGKCRGGVKGAERDVPAPARFRAPRVHARRVWRASRPTDVLPRSRCTSWRPCILFSPCSSDHALLCLGLPAIYYSVPVSISMLTGTCARASSHDMATAQVVGTRHGRHVGGAGFVVCARTEMSIWF